MFYGLLALNFTPWANFQAKPFFYSFWWTFGFVVWFSSYCLFKEGWNKIKWKKEIKNVFTCVSIEVEYSSTRVPENQLRVVLFPPVILFLLACSYHWMENRKSLNSSIRMKKNMMNPSLNEPPNDDAEEFQETPAESDDPVPDLVSDSGSNEEEEIDSNKHSWSNCLF